MKRNWRTTIEICRWSKWNQCLPQDLHSLLYCPCSIACESHCTNVRSSVILLANYCFQLRWSRSRPTAIPADLMDSRSQPSKFARWRLLGVFVHFPVHFVHDVNSSEHSKTVGLLAVKSGKQTGWWFIRRTGTRSIQVEIELDEAEKKNNSPIDVYV